MSSLRVVSSLVYLLVLTSCNRPSEPAPGPALSKPSAEPRGSGGAPEVPPITHHVSVHDRDMPDQPPPRPPSDNPTLIKASQILIAYQGALDAPPQVTRDKEAAKKLAVHVGQEARAGADFAGLVAKYSDDPATKANEGRVGQISRTQMAKPFTDAAFGLMVKEITTEPVETAYGFHIIKRTE